MRRLRWLGIALGIAILLIAVLAVAFRPAAPIQMNLGDGRVLQIEAVSYGTQHQAGTDSMLKRFRPWLPATMVRYFSLDRRANKISMDRPGLVVWVNAISEAGLTNVDCQGIRVEFVDRNGDLFGESTRWWFGGQDFWRVGHVFYCYPREEAELQLRVTTWRKGSTVTTKLRNPEPVTPKHWSGEALPQVKQLGEFQIKLAALTVRTNGLGEKVYYETATRFFEPEVMVLSHDTLATGWESPDWFAEAPNGNRGQFLGVHHQTLRFETTIYPVATNPTAAQVIAILPEVNLSGLATNLWWNATNSNNGDAVVALGIFHSGTHKFLEGAYQSSSLTVDGPGGGAPSGWTGDTRQVTPLKKVSMHNHYTPTPVIYLRVPPSALNSFTGVGEDIALGADRLAIRLREASGEYWIAEPDEEVNGIHPFRLEFPPDVTRIVPEIVLLKPLKAEFLVNTRNIAAP